jgi:hypothetical protein
MEWIRQLKRMEMENLDYRQTNHKKESTHTALKHTQKSMMVGTALMDFFIFFNKTQWRK